MLASLANISEYIQNLLGHPVETKPGKNVKKKWATISVKKQDMEGTRQVHVLAWLALIIWTGRTRQVQPSDAKKDIVDYCVRNDYLGSFCTPPSLLFFLT